MPTRPGELLTVSRALRVLRAFTEDHPSWGVTELADELDLDKSKVHRMLATLTQHGFTVLDPGTRRYTLGAALVQLGHRAEQSPGLRHRLEPHLDELAATTEESTVVCVPDGFRYRTIAARQGPGMVRYNTELGRSYPGHLGATGHAIFAFHHTVSVTDLLTADGHEPTEDEMAALRERHDRTRDDGHAVSDGEFDPRVASVAAPVMLEDQIFGSLSVLGPREYMHERSTQIAAAVLATATAVGETLQP